MEMEKGQVEKTDFFEMKYIFSNTQKELLTMLNVSAHWKIPPQNTENKIGKPLKVGKLLCQKLILPIINSLLQSCCLKLENA